VREHLATFLSMFREQHGKSLPHYVEQELHRYLRCGVLAHGFLRVVCSACRHEMLVAFSCKCRATCPSCGARRACTTAAHLIDDVLPDVPMRHCVLTAPLEVRRVLALRPDALTAEGRMFVEEIARWQKQQARAQGLLHAETAR
jgi:ribosomal protein S27E